MSSDLYSLSEAKKIYTNQLCKLLQPQIYKGLRSIWSLCRDTEEPLKNFQKKLEHIPRWNSLIIDDEYNRIVQETNCDYIDKLLDTVFIANAKILSVLNTGKKTIDINVPTPKKFLHSCYISCAYKIYCDPYLFDDRDESNISYRKQQKRLKESLEIITLSIHDTIENLLPLKDLLTVEIDSVQLEDECLLEDKPEINVHSNQVASQEEETMPPAELRPRSPFLEVLEGDNLYKASKKIPEFEENQSVHSEEGHSENHSEESHSEEDHSGESHSEESHSEESHSEESHSETDEDSLADSDGSGDIRLNLNTSRDKTLSTKRVSFFDDI